MNVCSFLGSFTFGAIDQTHWSFLCVIASWCEFWNSGNWNSMFPELATIKSVSIFNYYQQNDENYFLNYLWNNYPCMDIKTERKLFQQTVTWLLFSTKLKPWSTGTLQYVSIWSCIWKPCYNDLKKATDIGNST